MLGALLAAQNTIPVAQAMQGVVQDVSPIVAWEKEAVALLRRCPAWFTRHQLAVTLSRLSGLLLAQPAMAGGDQHIGIRSEAIEVWRSLVGKAPDAPVQLVVLLCDQAGSLVQQRASEAADLAREAVALAEGLPQSQSSGLAGLAEMNLAAALLTLGGAPETRELLQWAIKHLKPLDPHPVFSGRACQRLSEPGAGRAERGALFRSAPVGRVRGRPLCHARYPSARRHESAARVTCPRSVSAKCR